MHHASGSESPPTDAAKSAEPHLEIAREVLAGGAELREARAELRRHLEQWDLGDRVANAVLDVAHELIVNAHQHGRTPVRLMVILGISEVRVEVYDASPHPARLLPYRPGVSEHGLGLQLVRQLSRQWGQTMSDPGGPDAPGKCIWAVFPRRSPTSG